MTITPSADSTVSSCGLISAAQRKDVEPVHIMFVSLVTYNLCIIIVWPVNSMDIHSVLLKITSLHLDTFLETRLWLCFGQLRLDA